MIPSPLPPLLFIALWVYYLRTLALHPRGTALSTLPSVRRGVGSVCTFTPANGADADAAATPQQPLGVGQGSYWQ